MEKKGEKATNCFSDLLWNFACFELTHLQLLVDDGHLEVSGRAHGLVAIGEG